MTDVSAHLESLKTAWLAEVDHTRKADAARQEADRLVALISGNQSQVILDRKQEQWDRYLEGSNWSAFPIIETQQGVKHTVTKYQISLRHKHGVQGFRADTWEEAEQKAKTYLHTQGAKVLIDPPSPKPLVPRKQLDGVPPSVAVHVQGGGNSTSS